MTINSCMARVAAKIFPQFRHPGLLAIVLVAISLGVTGCKTTGTTPGDVEYNLFFSPGDHVEDLLAEKKVLEASKIYNDQREFFEEDSKSRRTISGKLWTALTGILTPELTAATAEIGSLTWPAPAAEWAGVKQITLTADALIERINGHAVITNGRFKYRLFFDYIKQAKTAKSKILNDAPKQFDAYQISTSQNFFAQFPIKLAPADFLNSNAPAFETRLADTNAEGIRHVYRLYGEDLPKSANEELARLHYQRVLATNDPPATTEKSKRSFRKILAAISDTKKAGLPLKTLPGTKVSLVEVTSKTLLREGQIEFPTAIEMDLPFDASKFDIDKAFSSETAKNAGIMVLFDVAVARTVRDVHTKESVASEYQTGTRKIPNPDCNMAQNELNLSMMRLQQTNMSKMSADSQYCEGFACLAKAIGQIAASNQISRAK